MGRNFDNESFKFFCYNNGMLFLFSCPHTSAQNGKVKRKIWTINNLIRTLLTHSPMQPFFLLQWYNDIEARRKVALESGWEEFESSCLWFISYQAKHSKILHPLKCYIIGTHRMHIYGFFVVCAVLYSLRPQSISSNLIRPHFLGFPPNPRGYKCYDLSSWKIIISRHVLFDESKFPLPPCTDL